MKKLLSIFIITILCFTSCQRIIWTVGIKGRTGLNNVSKFEHPESGKKVTLIGMSHIETVRYYEEVKNYLDSLRNDGYAIFFEGITIGPVGPTEADTAATKVMLRKYRRLTGESPLINEYAGFRSVADNKGERPRQLVQQTFERTGVSEERDHLCDLTFQEIIEGYEEKYGEILLTDCDWDTPHTAKYKCRTEQEFRLDYAHLTLRDKYVAKRVAESEYEKIVILYGNMHIFTMDTDLRRHGFEYTGHLISEKKKKR